MAKITKQRQVTYYIGIVMMVIGFLLFISVFIATARFMNDPFMYEMKPSFTNPIIGMILMIAGTVVMNIGAKGAAGSGLLLDPEKAREDLKPFSDAKGKMINDVVSNIDIIDNIGKSHVKEEIIKIKCRNCKNLNDEDAKFCKSCGKEI